MGWSSLGFNLIQRRPTYTLLSEVLECSEQTHAHAFLLFLISDKGTHIVIFVTPFGCSEQDI
jgi:hypothetical protein